MNNRLVALSIAILGAMVFGPSAQAQRHVASAPAGRPGAAVARRGSVSTRFVRQGQRRRFSSGSAFAPYFYSDYDSEPETVDAPPAQIIEQTAEPASAVPVPNRAGALVLELQDDHWVGINKLRSVADWWTIQSAAVGVLSESTNRDTSPNSTGGSERASARRARVSRWA